MGAVVVSAFAAVLAVVALVVSGCGSTRGTSPQAGLHTLSRLGTPTARTMPSPRSTTVTPAYDDAPGSNCPTSSADPAIGKLRSAPPRTQLPQGFRIVAVVRCTTIAHGAQRADTKLTDLTNALREPSQIPVPGEQVVCAAIGLQIPVFGLVGADGSVIRPQLPLTVCGMPMPNVMSALNGLPWTTEAASESMTANRPSTGAMGTLPSKPPAGCLASAEYLIGWPVVSSTIPWSQVRHPAMPPITLACVYRIDYGSTPEPVGTLVGGTTLTPDQTLEIQQVVDLAGSPAATPSPMSPPYYVASRADCPQPVHADRFVALGGPGDPLYLADLGGCSELRFPNGYLSNVPSGLAGLLAQVGIS